MIYRKPYVKNPTCALPARQNKQKQTQKTKHSGQSFRIIIIFHQQQSSNSKFKPARQRFAYKPPLEDPQPQVLHCAAQR
jgi:hypothetical protein